MQEESACASDASGAAMEAMQANSYPASAATYWQWTGVQWCGLQFTWSNSHSDQHTYVINYVSRGGNVCVLELFKCMALISVNGFANNIHCAGNYHVLDNPAAGSEEQMLHSLRTRYKRLCENSKEW